MASLAYSTCLGNTSAVLGDGTWTRLGRAGKAWWRVTGCELNDHINLKVPGGHGGGVPASGAQRGRIFLLGDSVLREQTHAWCRRTGGAYRLELNQVRVASCIGKHMDMFWFFMGAISKCPWSSVALANHVTSSVTKAFGEPHLVVLSSAMWDLKVNKPASRRVSPTYLDAWSGNATVVVQNLRLNLPRSLFVWHTTGLPRQDPKQNLVNDRAWIRGLNERGRQLARREGLLLVDSERMFAQLGKQPMWDLHHPRWQYAAVLANVYANLLKCATRTNTGTPCDTPLR